MQQEVLLQGGFMPTVLEESALVERAKEGDAEAFADLVRLFQGRIRAFFAARLGDPSMVDDLAQEAFIIAYQKLPECDASRPLLPWLKKIAQYVLLNASRKHRPQTLDPTDLDAVLDRLALDQADSLEDGDSEQDTLEGLRECLGKVQSVSLRLLEARYRHGLSVKVIARREGKTPVALSVNLVRIRQRLRQCLETRKFRTSFVEGTRP